MPKKQRFQAFHGGLSSNVGKRGSEIILSRPGQEIPYRQTFTGKHSAKRCIPIVSFGYRQI
ncbi:MAG TPA: hypothetical protein DDZ83_09225 [Nitrospinae bacterium]|nr:hypothetical protein [Nitrospinota bacterium]